MKKLVLALIIFVSLPGLVMATLGVGVGTGKITVDQKLKPGTIYTLPSLTVINTGNEVSDYEVTTTYNEIQDQLKPPSNWFIFSPQHFTLQPGKVQVVSIKLNVPVMTKPGNYFSYLEAHPVKKAKAGVTTVGIAAAAKLYFTIVPGNIVEGVYYKVASFFQVYAPWPQWIAVAIVVLIALGIFRKFFHIQINVKK